MGALLKGRNYTIPTHEEIWIQQYEERESQRIQGFLIGEGVNFIFDEIRREVIAVNFIPPLRNLEKIEMFDEKGRPYFFLIEIHYPACEPGTIIHDSLFQGVYDKTRNFPF